MNHLLTRLKNIHILKMTNQEYIIININENQYIICIIIIILTVLSQNNQINIEITT